MAEVVAQQQDVTTIRETGNSYQKDNGESEAKAWSGGGGRYGSSNSYGGKRGTILACWCCITSSIATKRIMVREARHGQEEEEDMAVATAMEAREVL